MKNKEHLPVYGVGPLYGFIIILATVIAIVLSEFGVINIGQFPEAKIEFLVLGIAIVIYGFTVWYRGAFKIDSFITSNTLCTDGIYGIVRNPCYSGIMLMCTGAIVIADNIILFILPFLYWLLMTILMKNTEEKWLHDLYGESYDEYCKKVNRCIPFPRRRVN